MGFWFLLGLFEVEGLVEVLVEALGENDDAGERPTRGIGALSVSKALRCETGVGIASCGRDRPRRTEYSVDVAVLWCRPSCLMLIVAVVMRYGGI